MKRLLKILVVLIRILSVTPIGLLPQNFPQDYVEIHNGARVRVGVSPLTWDPLLKTQALDFLNKHKVDCLKGVSMAAHVSIGQNIARKRGSQDFTGADAVRMWVAQEKNYDYQTNSCVRGICRCYTQVVWQTTTHVGCARVICDNNAGTIVSCKYNSSGNIPGIRPY